MPATAPNDDDPFPFGERKGTKYGDIPASYFLWLEEQDWLDKWPAVQRYIEANRHIFELEQEDPDAYGN